MSKENNKEKFKILIISSLFYPSVGGAERQSLQLANQLINNGIKVSVLTQYNKSLPEEEQLGEIKIYRKIKTINISHIWTLSYIWSVYKFLMKNKDIFDIVETNQIYLHTIAAVMAGKKLKKPVMAKTLSTGQMNDFSIIKKARLIKFFFKYINQISAVRVICQKMAEEISESGFQKEKIFKIPNGVDANYFKPSNEKDKKDKSIVFVGRLIDEIKGISNILKGFSIALSKNKDLYLHIVGDGNDREKLIALSRELKIEDKVKFHLEVKDPLKIYQESDIMVLASKIEGLPNVLLEAMSCGLACIATNVGGIPEVLHPESLGVAPSIRDGEIFKASHGILIPYGSPESVANAIEILATDDELRKKYSALSRERILSEFSFDKVITSYINLCEKLINDVSGQ